MKWDEHQRKKQPWIRKKKTDSIHKLPSYSNQSIFTNSCSKYLQQRITYPFVLKIQEIHQHHSLAWVVSTIFERLLTAIFGAVAGCCCCCAYNILPSCGWLSLIIPSRRQHHKSINTSIQPHSFHPIIPSRSQPPFNQKLPTG